MPLLSLLNPGPIFANEQKKDEILFSFAVIGHIHSMPEMYVQFLKMQKELGTSFIIVLGDFLLGDDVKKEWNNLQDYHKRYLKVPVYFLPGNHDIKNNSKYAREFYKENIGKINYSFVQQDVKFILISSFDTGGGEQFPPLQFLEHELAPRNNRDITQKFLFLHHALWFSQTEVSSHNAHSTSYTATVWNEEILPLVKKSGIRYIFSGDAHGYSYYEKDGIRYFLNGLPSWGYTEYYPIALKVDVLKGDIKVNLLQFQLDAYDLRYQDKGINRTLESRNKFFVYFDRMYQNLSVKRLLLIFLLLNIVLGIPIYIKIRKKR